VIQRKGTNAWTYYLRLFLVVLPIIAVLGALTVVTLNSLKGFPTNPSDSDMERRRKEWEREWRDHEREHERWERERNEHERRKEEDRKWSKLYWGEPTAGAHCVAYGTREYTARIWNVPLLQDWMTACKQTSIVIHNKTLETPTRCEDQVSDLC
jgi:hypothetical protein